jgi:hypothetical protein
VIFAPGRPFPRGVLRLSPVTLLWPPPLLFRPLREVKQLVDLLHESPRPSPGVALLARHGEHRSSLIHRKQVPISPGTTKSGRSSQSATAVHDSRVNQPRKSRIVSRRWRNRCGFSVAPGSSSDQNWWLGVAGS